MKIYDPKRILVPTDLTEFGEEVLEAGLEIGKLRDAEVVVLHVAVEPKPFSSFSEGHLPEDLFLKAREDAARDLNDQVEKIIRKTSPPPRVKSRLLFGEPASEILRAAESEKADLIVMGTRGRKGLSRIFQGSVTEEVLRRAPCPVLAMRVKRPAEAV